MAALEFPFEEAEEEGAVEAVGYSIDYGWVGGCFDERGCEGKTGGGHLGHRECGKAWVGGGG